MDTSLIEYLECPICYDFMSGQIMICVKGHSICHECYRRMNEEGRFLCPTCHNGILGNRNITLEKVSSKIKALMEVNNNAVLFNRKPNGKHGIVCPEECGFCTDKLIDLKSHLKRQHAHKITRITSIVHTKVQFKLIWSKQKEQSRFLVSLWGNIYVIYVKKCNDSYNIYVTVVSDEKIVYKYRSEYSNNYKICHFYKGSDKLYDYSTTLDPEKIVKDFVEKCFSKIYIERIGIL